MNLKLKKIIRNVTISATTINSMCYYRKLQRYTCVYMYKDSPVIRPLASIGGCQLIKMARGRPSRLITVKSLGAELGAVNKTKAVSREVTVFGGVTTQMKLGIDNLRSRQFLMEPISLHDFFSFVTHFTLLTYI